MNLDELEKKLVAAGVPRGAYCLVGGLPNEAYCIERQKDGKWRTYYSERGLRSRPKVFTTECDACKFLLSELLRAG